MMLQRFGQQFRRGKQKINQMRQKELKDFLAGLDNAPQQVTADLLSSLLKTAVADAEEIVASIKAKAQTEAEAEAARIIAQVKLEAQEIKDNAEIAARKQAEDILSAAKRTAETTAEEAKQKALQYIAGKEKVEQPVQLQEKAVKEEVEQPAQLREEAAVSEAAEVTTEEHLREERPDRRRHKPAPVKLDSKALYAGEVELIIAPPVELKTVSKLYSYLQIVPELKILYTRGSWDQGTTITVVLEKPMPFLKLMSEIPGVEVTPELLEKDELVTGKSSLPLKTGAKAVKRIKLDLKEAPSQ
ncbi:MAG: hypothetical protein ACETVS_02580 [Dehalococcoidales bacterium]